MSYLDKAKEGAPLPFLKWAGGKRWLSHLAADFSFSGKYIEPFAGSGAMYFTVRPSHGILGDANSELISTYQSVRDHPDEIEGLIRQHHALHSKEYYYHIRANRSQDVLQRSAEFIYLNRTCWNGLYRVNKKGIFNVPIGTKSSVVLESDDWRKVSSVLKNAEFFAGDFENLITKAVSGDLVFADPPYTVKHNFNGFVKYNESIFAWSDQIRLFESLKSAAQRGVVVVSTNAAHKSIVDLYRGFFKIQKLNRRSVLAGKSSARGVYEELLITANHE